MPCYLPASIIQLYNKEEHSQKPTRMLGTFDTYFFEDIDRLVSNTVMLPGPESTPVLLNAVCTCVCVCVRVCACVCMCVRVCV